MRDLPTRVVRVGGAVRTFDTARMAYKKVAEQRVARLLVPAGVRVVYPASPGSSWNNSKVRIERALVYHIEGAQKAENAMQTGFFYEEGQWVEPNEFDTDTAVTSAAGIHAFPDEAGARHW